MSAYALSLTMTAPLVGAVKVIERFVVSIAVRVVDVVLFVIVVAGA
jgi:hypothetical protein